MWRMGLCAAIALGGCIATHDFDGYVEVDDDASTMSQGGSSSGGAGANGGSGAGAAGGSGGAGNGGSGVGGSGPTVCLDDPEDGLEFALDFCGSSVRLSGATIDGTDTDVMTAFADFDSSCAQIVAGPENTNTNISYELEVTCLEGVDAYTPVYFCGSGSVDTGFGCGSLGAAVGIIPACNNEGERLTITLSVNGALELMTCEDYSFDFTLGGCIDNFDCANGEMCCANNSCSASC